MKIKLICSLLLFGSCLQAQYTYISDRRFFAPDDLVGYDFRPYQMEAPNEDKKELDAGEYSLGITFNNLYVKGEGIEGVYNINNIHPEEYGFKLALMNARDARLQGHLKVIVNKYGMVESLIFKRSPNEKELIFYLSPIPAKIKEQEKAYFTDRGEVVFEKVDSLWGKKFYPFLRIHKDTNVQERLRMKDSTSVSFLEVITIEEKGKKKKPGKETAAQATDSLVVATDTMATDSVKTGKVKITKEYFVIVRSILQYEDGTKEDKTWKYPVKRVVEKEDKNAGEQEERYQWEFISDKEKILLYLNGDHTVSTFEVGEKTYLMRGF